jgi:hypothetical protein
MATEGGAVSVGQTEIDGVPTFHAEVPGGPPMQAALMFRVGRADEALPRFGLTHLVEHLAMFAVGRVPFEANAFVDDTRAVFYALGQAGEVTGFLRSVCAGLESLPLDRLEAEKRVLETESSGNASSPETRLLSLRCGPRGYGLAHYRELASASRARTPRCGSPDRFPTTSS